MTIILTVFHSVLQWEDLFDFICVIFCIFIIGWFIIMIYLFHIANVQKIPRNLCVQWIKDNNNNERITYIQHSIYTSYIDMWCLVWKKKIKKKIKILNKKAFWSPKNYNECSIIIVFQCVAVGGAIWLCPVLCTVWRQPLRYHGHGQTWAGQTLGQTTNTTSPG